MSNITTQDTFTFQHPQLGPMTGVVEPDNVVQFRAIPYATIPARFKQSILNDGPLEGNGDFTNHGFACPQRFPEPVANGGLFPGESPSRQSDEFRCLILQINVPLACLKPVVDATKMPVLVYIHGGGFVLNQIDEQHNTALMVEQSILDSQPVISASIQYRLGALGYLHTPESGHANLALNDQRNALLWIQKFIGGFGGDSKRVTVFGESAGSISICAHMLASPPTSGPLFQRAILMSGIIGPMTMPDSIETASTKFSDYLERCGIEGQGVDLLRQLRELSTEEIVDASAKVNEDGGMWLSVLDDEWFGPRASSITWDKIPELIGQCDWVDDIVCGTTSFEGTTFMERLAGTSPKEFLHGIEKQLGPKASADTARAYGIDLGTDLNLALTAQMRWAGDVLFDAPQHMLSTYLASHTNKRIYRYVFDVRNPFPNNPLYQQAHHWVDIYFVFKTFQFRYPSQRLKKISTRHAQLWIDFTNGKEPWKQYSYTDRGEGTIMVANEREGWIERTVAQDEEIMELSWTRCEKLVATWEGVKGKSFEPLLIDPLKGKKLT